MLIQINSLYMSVYMWVYPCICVCMYVITLSSNHAPSHTGPNCTLTSVFTGCSPTSLTDTWLEGFFFYFFYFHPTFFSLTRITQVLLYKINVSSAPKIENCNCTCPFESWGNNLETGLREADFVSIPSLFHFLLPCPKFLPLAIIRNMN